MKYKNEIIITFIITFLVLFLKFINVFQIENKLGYPIIMILIILIFSMLSIFIQKIIDKNYESKKVNYENLDILKYISAILIIILHLRPFIDFSNELDLAFNNIITRICVPIFFVITGYFVAKKEITNNNYINDYIKQMIPLYIVWSIIYIPVIIGTIIQYLPTINSYISTIDISFALLIMLLIILLPVALLIALVYTGIYYHLWYFPAVIFSLLFLKKWKAKFNIKSLLLISFVFLLFGATETYWGVIPITFKQLLSYYYNIFFTTRNFLFFGLFYVVLGYYLGSKKEIYSKYCFEKFIISIFLLVFEAILLHDTNRLNSNILISCVPLVYYLFISIIYFTNKIKNTKRLRNFSKYYYFVHPMMIYLLSLLNININSPFINIILVLFLTHIISMIIISIKNKNKKLII